MKMAHMLALIAIFLCLWHDRMTTNQRSGKRHRQISPGANLQTVYLSDNIVEFNR